MGGTLTRIGFFNAKTQRSKNAEGRKTERGILTGAGHESKAGGWSRRTALALRPRGGAAGVCAVPPPPTPRARAAPPSDSHDPSLPPPAVQGALRVVA